MELGNSNVSYPRQLLVDQNSLFSYEMMIGIPPFYNREQNHNLMFKNIKEKDVNFGSKIKMSEEAKDLIVKVGLAFDPQLIILQASGKKPYKTSWN